MVEKLQANLKVPVTCKIRCLPTSLQTLHLSHRLAKSGASLLTVHGRCRLHKKQQVGVTNLDIIRRIKEELEIPVVANGGISNFDDVEYVIRETGVDGVMSSECVLENPALFTGMVPDLDEIAEEYLQMVEQYPGEV